MDVASTPPPPPPPQQNPFDVKLAWLDSPATREGTYDVIGRLTVTPGNGSPTTSRNTAPDEFTMSSSRYFDDDPFQYVLNGPAGLFPGGSITVNEPYLSWSFSVPPGSSRSFANEPSGSYCCQLLGQHMTVYSKAADGSETEILSNDLTRAATDQQPIGTNNNLHVTLNYDIGYSYVAMGEWSWRTVDLNGATVGDSSDLLFVDGDRTPAAGIPVSGTATYDAHSLALRSSNGTLGIPFTLTADFGQRTIGTRIDQDYANYGTNDPIQGIHVAGSAPFSNEGSFDIPLTGSVNYSYQNVPVPPPSEPVTGDMNGAFFGPHAEQVGGIFSVHRSGETSLLQDAFVGQQRPH